MPTKKQSMPKSKAAPAENGPKTISNVGSDTNAIYPFKTPRMQDFDPDDEDYIRELRRPAVIKEDLNQMERSKRVRQILNSEAFREELEKLVVNEQHGAPSTGANLAEFRSLQQLSDLIMPNSGRQATTAFMGNASTIVPIADLRGSAAAKFSKSERLLRNKFASLFRLIDLFRWTHGISSYCTLRISEQHMLTNPLCLMHHEITAGSLLKVDLCSNALIDELSSSSKPHSINESEFKLHSVIYEKRPDVKCIIRMNTPVLGAVAAMKCGLLPICQESMIVGEISLHEFTGYSVHDSQEMQQIAIDLGPTNKVLLMRNTGFIICGSSVEEAFDLAYNLVQACETQIRAIRAGLDNLVIPSLDAQQKVHDIMQKGEALSKTGGGQPSVKWKTGHLEWEAWMRVLDNAGFRTGHIYRNPVGVSTTSSSRRLDIQSPPSAVSTSGFDTTDNVQRPIMFEAESLGLTHHSAHYNQKADLDGRGSSLDSKKIIRWVQTESPLPHQYPSQPIQVSMMTSPHQFLPQMSSPSPNARKELKQKQQMIREQGRVDNISAGPQSKLLDGVSFQEAAALKLLQDAQAECDLHLKQDKTLIGAASKGIVERDHKYDAQIFTQLYSSNPFAGETDQEIRKYVDEVGQKTGHPAAFQSNSSTLDRLDEFESGRSESPESVSLMQAARELNLSRLTTTPTPTRTPVVRETTFHAVSDQSNTVTRSISPRVMEQGLQPATGISDGKPTSEDESLTTGSTSLQQSKKGKKKKFHKLSFLRSKKDKETRNISR